MKLTVNKQKILSLLPLIPLWYFMLNLFSMYSLLRPRYPESTVIWIGAAVMGLLVFLSLAYIRQIFRNPD